MGNSLPWARRLRPMSFDGIVGQELTISMLRNGLYSDRLFPAYLFAGQRGCGKTTTARVLAAAVNCKNLEKFRNDPRLKIPCLQCDSCIAMKSHNHPDFFEVDAASNTGVDHVRQILEAANYLPLLGTKKIYLIDEAHMLSRAAFNALLKMLEEPPASVLFMLATTEIEKIPDTVRSRCFHALFGPLEQKLIVGHLETVCKDESIIFTTEALAVIAEQSGGSLRDALNLMEQVASAETELSVESVRKTLGIVAPSDLVLVGTAIATKDSEKLLTTLTQIDAQKMDIHALWRGITQLLNIMVREKVGAPWNNALFESERKNIGKLVSQTPINRIYALMQLFWNYEENFLRTSQKYLILEHVLIQMANQVDICEIEELIQSHSRSANQNKAPAKQPTKPARKLNLTQPKQPQTEQSQTEQSQKTLRNDERLAKDKMLQSIFRQSAKFTENAETNHLELHIPVVSAFLEEKVEQTRELWLPVVQAYYPNVVGVRLVAATSVKKPVNRPMAKKSTSRGPGAKLIEQLLPGKIEVEK